MLSKTQTSAIVHLVLILGLVGGMFGMQPVPAAALAINEDTLSSTALAACVPGTIWTWTTGPSLPEAARQAEASLRGQGIETAVTAHGYGEKDNCGNFELHSIDYDVTLLNDGALSANKQEELSEKVLAVLRGIPSPQLGNVQINNRSGNGKLYPSYTPQSSLQTPLQTTQNQTADAGTISTKNVYLLVFDPILLNGLKLSEYIGWNSGTAIAQDIVSYFPTASGGEIHYNIAQINIVTNGFPRLVDGFTYNETTYLDVFYGRAAAHQPDTADYDKIIDDYGICQKVNSGEIDELWMYGAPWFGFYESRLIGPNAYGFNSPPMLQTHGCNRLVPIMGLNYERGLPEAIHSFGHRAEATMTRTYGYWAENNTRHNWEKFALVKAQSPNYSYSGCGSIHYPPNGVQDYDYSNPNNTLTNCDDFLNYPNLSNPLIVSQPVTCNTWGCTELGFLTYWYSHLPVVANCDLNAVANNWWLYFSDPNQALYPSMTCPPPPCPTITEWQGEYWNNSSFIGPPVLCRNDTDINFAWGGGSPDPGIAGDHFAARWTRTIHFNEGLYRFSIMNDDGARLYINDVVKVDAWGSCCNWSHANVPLAAGDYTIRMDMFENDGGAGAQLLWEYIGPLPADTPTSTPTRTPTSTATPKGGSTSTPTNTPTRTPTPTSTSTSTPTSTATTGGPTSTPTNTPTTTPTSTNTPTRTPTPTTSKGGSTSTPTNTPTMTPTPTATPTSGPTSTPTNTPTATPTSTNTPTSTPTNTPGSGSSLTFNASADSYVQSTKRNSNYGSNVTILVDGATSPTYEGYLKFTVSGITGTVQSAVLRVYATAGAVNSVDVYGAGNSWTETGLTWSNKPARTTAVLDSESPITVSSWVEYNVTALVNANGTYTFVLAKDISDSAGFSSKEGTQPPQLIVTFAP